MNTNLNINKYIHIHGKIEKIKNKQYIIYYVYKIFIISNNKCILFEYFNVI